MTYFSKRAKDFGVPDKQAVAEQFPKNSLVELTNACNHACVFCHNPFMHRTTGVMNKDLFKRFIEEAAALGLEEVGLYSTGEPFVVKNLAWYIQCAKDAGVRRVYLTSNGVLATVERVKAAVEAGLDSLKFSINAATRESYQLTHGVDEFDLAVKNVDDIYNWKQESGASLQLLGSFIHTRLTKDEVELHRSIFSKYFEDIVYLQAMSQGGRTGERIKEIIERPPHADMSTIKPCEMLWNRVHMTWEGYLTACCVDYEHDLTFADFNSGAPLAELWNNESIRNLRQRHLDRDLDNLICKSCLLGEASPYEPISDLQGKFVKKGKLEDGTVSRIKIAVQQVPAEK